jgi:Polyketide cyclase / dehydrase and lipid transport
MTETAERSTGATNEQAPEPDTDDASSALPSDRLKQAAEALVRALSDKAVGAAVDRVEGLTGKLTDVAESGGEGLSGLLGGGGGDGGGDAGGGLTGALKSGASTIKDKVTGALGMGGGDEDDPDGGDGDGGGDGGGGGSGGGRGKFKFMNIFEAQDVGVPLRVAYDQWTQFADFPSFMKKVETVNQESDEKSVWTAKVFWSRRSWDTTIREQIADSHIIWVSSGAKGHADGIVTFSELAPNLTRIVLILEYYPQGFFEKTGNLWRAVGRRARLEFKHFCRHVMMDTLINRDELEGWRGEIRDSEVVKTHEEAMEEEQAAAEDSEDEFDDDLEDEDGLDAEDEALADDEDEPAAEGEPTDDELEDAEASDDVEDADDELEDVDAEDTAESEDVDSDDVAEDTAELDGAQDVGDAEASEDQPDEDTAAAESEPEPRPKRPRRRQRTSA